MRVLHLVSGNRWTGAAAPAFEEVEALRASGVEAHYAYVGGYRLEAKIGYLDFVHAVIDKAQNPVTFARSVSRLKRLIQQYGIDIVHSHLTYDHWLGRFAASRPRVRLARTFHARRVLRSDPLSRSLIRRTDHLFVINDAFRSARAFDGRFAVYTPPPVDHRQFSPAGPDARARHGIAADAKLVTVIGKLSRGRGFEQAMHTFAALRPKIDCRMMIIGRGVHRPALEALSHSLGIAPALTWAGYHEDEPLAEHYRASDLLLFTARGSDEGHRAIIEAMACGVPVATYPIEGVDALVSRDWIAGAEDPQALAATAAALLTRSLPRDEVAAHTAPFSRAAAAERLIAAYGA